MSTQARKKPRPLDTARGDVAAIGDPQSWFSVATVVISIGLAACAAAGVADTHGPVFTQPLTGP